jgi:nitroimidazol reductase NimA-like FMN-containing flavoprotein (pyridoxamine 5'-phosphate oxidase superfamily)
MLHLASLLVTEPSLPSSSAELSPPSDRTRVRRLPELAEYERARIDALLDGSSSCHVGIVVDGQPYVIPTLYARLGDELVLHGSVASRLMRHVRDGSPICVTVTELDGLVLARSAFETSLNYRSVVVLGTGRLVEHADERLTALRAISEAVLPGRWDDVRAPTPVELRQTMVVAVAIDECSAKVSSGHPEDPEVEWELPVWAGRVPLRRVADTPIPAPDLRAGIEVPDYLADWVGRHR